MPWMAYMPNKQSLSPLLQFLSALLESLCASMHIPLCASLNFIHGLFQLKDNIETSFEIGKESHMLLRDSLTSSLSEFRICFLLFFTLHFLPSLACNSFNTLFCPYILFGSCCMLDCRFEERCSLLIAKNECIASNILACL